MKIKLMYVRHDIKQHKDLGTREFGSLAGLLQYLNTLNASAAVYGATYYISHEDMNMILKEAK